jgi:hypothetical protein
MGEVMTNYELLIKDIAERITGSLRARLRDAKVDTINSLWVPTGAVEVGNRYWHDHQDITPIGIETSVGRLDSFSDVKPLLRSQTDVKRRAFDKGAQARGGVITGKDTIV